MLRSHILWTIWCQRVAHSFKAEQFHLGIVLWQAWCNIIYCAMEAYKELFKHQRNEERRHEIIHFFQIIWTKAKIFRRLGRLGIKWNLIPHPEFLLKDLGAWTARPIQIHQASQSPDGEAEFTARPDFQNRVNDFIQNIGRNWHPPPNNPNKETPEPHTQSWQQTPTSSRHDRTHERIECDEGPRLAGNNPN